MLPESWDEGYPSTSVRWVVNFTAESRRGIRRVSRRFFWVFLGEGRGRGGWLGFFLNCDFLDFYVGYDFSGRLLLYGCVVLWGNLI